VAFEISGGLRWLDQVSEQGTVLLNRQAIHPVTVTSGFAGYPDQATVDGALQELTARVYRVAGSDIARGLGNARVLNMVLLGALSDLLEVKTNIWEQILRERVPAKYAELNLRAFHSGQRWLAERI
jgi:indolepyruvate ferredoxin oxidoreductase beta subunit